MPPPCCVPWTGSGGWTWASASWPSWACAWARTCRCSSMAATPGPRRLANGSLRWTCRQPGTCSPTRKSEEHTSELQSLMRISYAVFCLQKKIELRNPPPQHIHLRYEASPPPPTPPLHVFHFTLHPYPSTTFSLAHHH